MSILSQFPAPASYETTPKALAYRAMRAAARLAVYLDNRQGTYEGARQHVSRFEEIGWAEDYADGSLDSRHVELGIYTGNWNGLDTYNREWNTRQPVSGGKWPEMLCARLEKLGAEVVWSDQHSTCDDCGKLICTDADSHCWEPGFAVAHGSITCKGCILDGIGSADEIVEGAAKALYADAWCSVNDECEAVSTSGCEIMDLIGEIPEQAYEMARAFLAKLCEANDLQHADRTPNLERLLSRVLQKDLSAQGERDYGHDYAESLGHYLAMQAMGHGVAWSDDHADHDFELPHLESGELDDAAATELGAELSEGEDGESKWQVA